jgi:hypothetical protein
MAYCIEIKNGETWQLKDWGHSKIPTEEKANERRTQLIDEGEHATDDVRVSVDNDSQSSPLDPSIEGNTWED